MYSKEKSKKDKDILPDGCPTHFTHGVSLLMKKCHSSYLHRVKGSEKKKRGDMIVRSERRVGRTLARRETRELSTKSEDGLMSC